MVSGRMGPNVRESCRIPVRSLALLCATCLLLPACRAGGSEAGVAPDAGKEERWMTARKAMVSRQIEARGVSDPRVLEAMRTVPRHRFVAPELHSRAYEDHPLPIGLGQTISQPYIVAAMTELLRPEPTDRVLEVGTGSGYQAAVLSRLVAHVYSIEILPELAKRAAETLAELGYDNVTVSTGDGYRGIPSEAPFDGIIVTAAPAEIPQPLIDQLAVGGRLVIPVGHFYQELKLVEKTEKGIESHSIFPVRFVPMTGEAQR